MAELADAIDLGSIVNRRAGSSPVIRIVYVLRKHSSAGMSVRLTRERSGVRAPLLPFLVTIQSDGKVLDSYFFNQIKGIQKQ